jgi:8-oxo-dGTP pyrophosphatase MutT (NUDIX family)
MCIIPSTLPLETLSSNVDTQQYKRVYCANCGGLGHIYKTCNHPIISYGIIVYQHCFDLKTNSVYPKYLMVQRKDSLCYVEFIRGKYELGNKKYILQLFSNMTDEERLKIMNNDFETLWKSMWCHHIDGHCVHNTHNTRSFNKEYTDSNIKFKRLLHGYYIINADTGNKTFFNIKYIIENTTSEVLETEWGFPKGRRNINEDDLSCAIREFKEETGIFLKDIKINFEMKPLEEVFTGSNKVRYKHVYYLAKYNPTLITQSYYNPQNSTQVKEVKDVQWFTYQQAQDRIRCENIERKELFKRLNNTLIKSLLTVDKNVKV